jgi:two-component system OmpR family sensor kinase
VIAVGRYRRPLTLRTRLLLTIAAVSAAISIAVAGIAVLAVQQMAMGNVDQQLMAVARRSPGPNQSGQPDQTPLPAAVRSPGASGSSVESGQSETLVRERLHDFLERPGQAVGTLAAEIPGRGAPVAAVLGETQTATDVDAASAAELAALAGHTSNEPITISLGGLGDYRVAAMPAPDIAGTTVVMGVPLAEVRATVYGLAAVLVAVAVIGLAVVLAAGSLLLRVALRPLDRVRTTAARVSELPLERGDVALAERVPDADPRTEVGQVGAALNRMLEHIAGALTARQASEMRLRRFVADASHELRTPLASVRGYAELMRRRPEPLPADVAHALSRVESESLRMGGLVEDLLLLARLDEGRPVDSELVDLSRLITDAAGDAAVTGPDHDWQVRLPDHQVTALGDQARLTQLVVNVLANARTHTPPGTTVRVELHVEPSESLAGQRETSPGDVRLGVRHAVLTVADTGPGMDAELAAEAFERFTRGDESRSRTAGSTGLGLAIVDAVARAHGGSAELVSTPGRGTVVTVRLPAVELDADDVGISDDGASTAVAQHADTPAPAGRGPLLTPR